MITESIDLKKIFEIILIFTLTVSLCCCVATQQKKTYFVHSAGFETKGKDIRLTVLLEEHGKQKDDFFTKSFTSSSITAAAKELMTDYKDCYFATCDLYLISIDVKQNTISSIAKEICDSNIFPTTGNIICTAGGDLQGILASLKNSDKISQLKSNIKDSINVVRFFAAFSSGTAVSADAFKMEDDEATRIGKATFINSGKAVLHEDH